MSNLTRLHGTSNMLTVIFFQGLSTPWKITQYERISKMLKSTSLHKISKTVKLLSFEGTLKILKLTVFWNFFKTFKLLSFQGFFPLLKYISNWKILNIFRACSYHLFLQSLNSIWFHYFSETMSCGRLKQFQYWRIRVSGNSVPVPIESYSSSHCHDLAYESMVIEKYGLIEMSSRMCLKVFISNRCPYFYSCLRLLADCCGGKAYQIVSQRST